MVSSLCRVTLKTRQSKIKDCVLLLCVVFAEVAEVTRRFWGCVSWTQTRCCFPHSFSSYWRLRVCPCDGEGRRVNMWYEYLPSAGPSTKGMRSGLNSCIWKNYSCLILAIVHVLFLPLSWFRVCVECVLWVALHLMGLLAGFIRQSRYMTGPEPGKEMPKCP